MWVVCAALFAVALAPRVVAALVVPSVDWDAYEYTEKARLWRDALADGRVPLSLLYGFWLPLYTFVAGALQVVWDDAYLAPKMLSAVCGAGGCVLAYLVTARLVKSRVGAIAAFVALAAGPYHVLYSASAMTEVPNALLVTACLWAALGGRWKTAAALGAPACLLRYDAWVLAPLVPLLAWRDGRRRDALVAAAILGGAIGSWFLICELATGSPFTQLRLRDRYLAMYYEFHADTTALTLANVRVNLDRLMFVAGRALIAASTIVAVVSWVRRGDARRREPRIAAAFFYAYLGFLAFSYLSKNQPDLWVRYGLIVGVLGVPFFVWALAELGRMLPRAAIVLWPVFGMVFVAGAAKQAEDAIYQVRNLEPQQLVASYLAEEARRDPRVIVFCDDPAVRVLARLGRERFVRSVHVRQDSRSPLEALRARGVTHVVYTHVETSLLVQVSPELARGEPVPGLTPLIRTPIRAAFHGGEPTLWLYKLESYQAPPGNQAVAPWPFVRKLLRLYSGGDN